MDTPRFEAVLFGAGLPPHGERVRVELRSRALVVTDRAGHTEEVDYSQVRGASGGWHGGALLLEWEGERGARTLSVHQNDALAVFHDRAPDLLRAKLGRLPRPSRSGVPRGWIVAGGLLAAAALGVVLLLATQADRLVDVAVRRIPPAWEKQLGEQTVAPFLHSGRVVTAGDSVQVVQEIGARLVAQSKSPYEFRWYVVDDPQVNALAAPGGVVVVFTGLLGATDSAEELAGVLAHEVQHVLLRHSLRGLVRQLGLRATLSIVFGGSGDLGGVMAGMAEKLGGLRFSRQQESEADVAGVKLLEAAGIDPRGMATFFEKLAKRGGEPPAFLSTHPASAERARRIRDLVADAPAPPPLPYPWTWN